MMMMMMVVVVVVTVSLLNTFIRSHEVTDNIIL